MGEESENLTLNKDERKGAGKVEVVGLRRGWEDRQISRSTSSTGPQPHHVTASPNNFRTEILRIFETIRVKINNLHEYSIQTH